MTAFVDAHRETLDRALAAIADRGYWSNYPESPSPRVYGEGAAADGQGRVRGPPGAGGSSWTSRARSAGSAPSARRTGRSSG